MQQRVTELMEQLGLLHWQSRNDLANSRKASELLIACAFAHKPDVLVLDEPPTR